MLGRDGINDLALQLPCHDPLASLRAVSRKPDYRFSIYDGIH